MPHYTRREFAKLALATLPAAGVWSALHPLSATAAPAGKPNSKFAGVQVGLNVPYSFANPAMSGDEILANCLALGISAVELRAQPVEAFLGAPAGPVSAKGAVAKGAAADANAGKMQEFRRTAPVDRLKAFRRKYEDAGVRIEILKVDRIFKLKDHELDYMFGMAKALGAVAISTEISHEDEEHRRVGAFADKHKLRVGLHGHATTTPEHWEKAFTFAKYLGANVDIGHFTAGNNISPLPFIEKYHDRVTHLHLKDRKKQNGPNVPFGEGDTPIAQALRLLREKKWPIQATIEFEYPVPKGSDRMKEIARALKYCRDALV